jgi:sulfatase maturation enzyme AslB (radical SAM superfamily)
MATTPLQPSRHNIVGPIRGTASWFVVNPLSGMADVVTADEATAIRDGRADAAGLYAQRGYLVDPAEEEGRYRRAYLDFLDDRDGDEVQLFFAPWYACNFGCTYCYQGDYAPTGDLPGPEVLDAFFAYVDGEFQDRRTY